MAVAHTRLGGARSGAGGEYGREIAGNRQVKSINLPLINIIQKINLTPVGVYCLAFSFDGRHLACHAADKRVRGWHLMDWFLKNANA